MSAPISNPVLTNQAELLATKLGLTDFTEDDIFNADESGLFFLISTCLISRLL